MVIDTDVLIWYMRGNEKAYQLIENSNNFFISVITYPELFIKAIKKGRKRYHNCLYYW